MSDRLPFLAGFQFFLSECFFLPFYTFLITTAYINTWLLGGIKMKKGIRKSMYSFLKIKPLDGL